VDKTYRTRPYRLLGGILGGLFAIIPWQSTEAFQCLHRHRSESLLEQWRRCREAESALFSSAKELQADLYLTAADGDRKSPE